MRVFGSSPFGSRNGEALKGPSTGEKLLEVVKLTVMASVRILVEGGSYASDAVHDFVDEGIRELGEEDAKSLLKRKYW